MFYGSYVTLDDENVIRLIPAYGKNGNLEYNCLYLKFEKKLLFKGVHHGQLYRPRDMEYKTR